MTNEPSFPFWSVLFTKDRGRSACKTYIYIQYIHTLTVLDTYLYIYLRLLYIYIYIYDYYTSIYIYTCPASDLLRCCPEDRCIEREGSQHFSCRRLSSPELTAAPRVGEASSLDLPYVSSLEGILLGLRHECLETRQSQGVLLMEAESNSQNANSLASFLSNLGGKPEIS